MITTKKGDMGFTSLHDGTRVGKDDARIELNGQLDELNALLGLCKAAAGQAEPYEQIQKELMTVMTVVAGGMCGDSRAAAWTESLDRLEQAVERMEICIREVTSGRKFDFVLPGRDIADAALHLARTKTRTCERRLVALMRQAEGEDAVSPYSVCLRYLNRLSDYLFSWCVR